MDKRKLKKLARSLVDNHEPGTGHRAVGESLRALLEEESMGAEDIREMLTEYRDAANEALGVLGER